MLKKQSVNYVIWFRKKEKLLSGKLTLAKLDVFGSRKRDISRMWIALVSVDIKLSLLLPKRESFLREMNQTL